MGWSFSSSWRTRADLLGYLRAADRFTPGYTLMKSVAVGNNHWYLCKRVSDNLIFIGLDLMKGGTRKEPGWGYKSMDEFAGPVAVNCPLSFLDEAAAPTGHAIAWRKQVEAFHAQSKALAQLTLSPGRLVTYGEHTYELLQSLGRRGWRVKRVSDQMIFRMRSRQLNEALREELSATT